MWLPEEDKYTNRKNELIAGLAVGMGGRVAEEIVFGDVTNGARETSSKRPPSRAGWFANGE
jgi:ATP-dependent Zn proteases